MIERRDQVILGEHFAERGADETFGFSPELGIHDVHIMHGNRGSFVSDKRVNGDGALFIRFDAEKPSPCSLGSRCRASPPTTRLERQSGPVETPTSGSPLIP